MQKLIQFLVVLSVVLLSTYSTVAQSVESKSPGFIRRNPNNPYRFVDAAGKPFYPIGINDCFGLRGSDVMKYWGLDGGEREARLVGIDEYLAAYAKAGFNTFRWGVGSCSFRLDTDSDWARGDQLAAKLKEYGFRILFVFFHNKIDANPDNFNKAYVKKAIDRYTGVVDIWEVTNESQDSDAALINIADYIKANDPNRHPVTTSFVYPPPVRDISVMNITSPHFYTYADEFQVEKETFDNIINWKRFGKPVIIGEYGNARINWDQTTDLKNRLATWLAFFAEGSIIFWNSSSVKGYSNPNIASAAYLGEVTRGYIKVLTDFTKEVPRDARLAKIEVNKPNLVRVYGLSSSSAYFAYLHAFTNHQSQTNDVKITIDPQTVSYATWVEPATGRVLATDKVSAGRQTLTVPPFLIDVALKISRSPPVKK